MPKDAAFDATFTTLRGLLTPYAKDLLVQVDEPGNYQLCSRTLTDRIGRPLFVAAVQVRKNYVSYHLMPVYAVPQLLKGISPTLKKRMQGKSCFNFTTIDPAHAKELSALTNTGIAAFRNVTLPWAGRRKGSATQPQGDQERGHDQERGLDAPRRARR